MAAAAVRLAEFKSSLACNRRDSQTSVDPVAAVVPVVVAVLQVQVAVQRQELHAQRKLESGKVRRA